MVDKPDSMKKILLVLVAILPFIGLAQDEKKFGIQFTGFVKSDIFFDTRETVDVREGHFLLYPQNERLDPEGNDLNENLKFHLLSVQTRLKGTISGPDALGAKTSGIIEGEFFGSSTGDLYGFRLRHAFVKLNWTNTELLVGQYWHPMFNTKCFPGTVSFNTGVPFEPFTRNPQVRVTQKLGLISLALTAMSQYEFKSTGPEGPSTIYLRNAATPIMNLTVEYENKNTENGREFLVGASGNYKTIQPLTETAEGYKTTTKVNSFGASAFFKYTCKPVTVKLHYFYGQDATDLTMLGGYAVKSVTDVNKGLVEYTPIMNNSTWIDVNTNGKTWQFGVFGGYTKNLGAQDEIKGAIYSRGADIDYVYRASGRVIYNNGKFRVAPELEYTAASYAINDSEGNLARDVKGKITQSKEVANFRFLIGVYYFF